MSLSLEGSGNAKATNISSIITSARTASFTLSVARAESSMERVKSANYASFPSRILLTLTQKRSQIDLTTKPSQNSLKTEIKVVVN